MRAAPPDITIVDTFIEGHHPLLHRLLLDVRWDDRLRVRKTASFGIAYDYSQMAYPDAPMHPELATLCDALALRLGFRPNNCLLNLYPDGSSSMGFHSDATDRLRPGTGIAIVSLGAARTIRSRSKTDKTVAYSYRLTGGSLLFMSLGIQDDWVHAVPPEPGAGSRISLTFRSVLGRTSAVDDRA